MKIFIEDTRIKSLSKTIHQINISKGFYEGEKNTGEMLALVHGEVSEGLEADRNGRYVGELDVFSLLETAKDDTEYMELYEKYVKGTFDEEMADTTIRLFDLCEFKGIDLDKHIQAKMYYNKLRPYKHGKKY